LTVILAKSHSVRLDRSILQSSDSPNANHVIQKITNSQEVKEGRT